MKTYSAKQLLAPENSALLDEIVLMIAHSFSEDASTKYLFVNPDREDFVIALPKYMRILVLLALYSDASVTVITKDEVPATTTTDDGTHVDDASRLQVIVPADSTIRALSILIPPHGNPTFGSAWNMLRSGLWTIPFACGLPTTQRFLFQFLPEMSKLHENMFPDHSNTHQNWHLLFLATHPDNRGQGLGKKLLVRLQDFVTNFNSSERLKAKDNGVPFAYAPLYLEASNANNRRLYSRVGFEQRASLAYGDIGVHEDEAKIATDGSVIGGRVFGMIWVPPTAPSS